MTPSFELISNESSKVRVLDVPGFFGEGDAGKSLASAKDKAHSSANVAVVRMRNILQIQSSMHMKFRKILYFLPVHGALRRSDAYLETELTALTKYFGKAIFDCMIIIATMPTEAYDDDNQIGFSAKAVTTTKKNFASVLARVLPNETNLPDPPILFISMEHTCETVLSNVKSTEVACDHVTLRFNELICARCGCKANLLDSAQAEGDESKGVTVYTDKNEFSTIPYEDSTCHPLFVPKYTKVARFFGGIVYVVSFKKLCKSYLDEECVHCQESPGTRGCTKVKTWYKLKEEYLMVDHTSNTSEPIKVESAANQTSLPSKSEPSSAVLPTTTQTPMDTPTSGTETYTETNVDSSPLTSSYLESKGT